MSEIKRLQRRLERQNVTHYGISWGPDAHLLTPEQRARAVNQMMDQIDAGNYTEGFNDDCPKTDIRDLLGEKIDPTVLERISE